MNFNFEIPRADHDCMLEAPKFSLTLALKVLFQRINLKIKALALTLLALKKGIAEFVNSVDPF